MSTLTDWITAISTAATTLGGAIVFLIGRNEKLPLIEPQAHRYTDGPRKGFVRVSLQMTNKIPEALAISRIKVRYPRGAALHEANRVADRAGIWKEFPATDSAESIDYNYEIAKSSREPPVPEVLRAAIFYLSGIPDNVQEIKVSFCLSSSARTIENRRLTVTAKVQTT
ncbi:hypothetical protein ABUE34_12795 [Kozakia baliensis]|uniref:hypothetical protein n=1 Tax=Kozakia baliensis TaxID=153496 RepID=UPI00345C1B7C